MDPRKIQYRRKFFLTPEENYQHAHSLCEQKDFITAYDYFEFAYQTVWPNDFLEYRCKIGMLYCQYFSGAVRSMNILINAEDLLSKLNLLPAEDCEKFNLENEISTYKENLGVILLALQNNSNPVHRKQKADYLVRSSQFILDKVSEKSFAYTCSAIMEFNATNLEQLIERIVAAVSDVNEAISLYELDVPKDMAKIAAAKQLRVNIYELLGDKYIDLAKAFATEPELKIECLNNAALSYQTEIDELKNMGLLPSAELLMSRMFIDQEYYLVLQAEGESDRSRAYFERVENQLAEDTLEGAIALIPDLECRDAVEKELKSYYRWFDDMVKANHPGWQIDARLEQKIMRVREEDMLLARQSRGRAKQARAREENVEAGRSAKKARLLPPPSPSLPQTSSNPATQFSSSGAREPLPVPLSMPPKKRWR